MISLHNITMANECVFCGARHIETNTIVTPDSWIEFCNFCGENKVLRNATTDETLLPRELFERAAATTNGKPWERKAEDIAKVDQILQAEARQMVDDNFQALADAECDEYYRQLDEAMNNPWPSNAKQ